MGLEQECLQKMAVRFLLEEEAREDKFFLLNKKATSKQLFFQEKFMKKINRLLKNSEFKKVLDNKKSVANKEYIIF